MKKREFYKQAEDFRPRKIESVEIRRVNSDYFNIVLRTPNSITNIGVTRAQMRMLSSRLNLVLSDPNFVHGFEQVGSQLVTNKI